MTISFHLGIKTVSAQFAIFADTRWERQGFPSRNQDDLIFKTLRLLEAGVH